MKKIFIPIAVLTLLAACSNKESDKKLNDFAQNDIQMELNFKNFSWTRQPESCIIKDDTIEVTTKPKQIFGNAPTTIFATTMHLYSKWKQKRNSLVSL